MSIELRSLNSIRNATQALTAGDYSTASRLNLRLFTSYFTSATTDQYEEHLVTFMESLDASTRQLDSLDIRPTISDMKHSKDCLLPVRALATAIEKASSLEVLYMVNLCLVGSKQDFERLAVALQGCVRLKKFYYACGTRLITTNDEHSNDDDDDEAISPISGVLETLGKNFALESVEMYFGTDLGKLSLSTLTSLGRPIWLNKLWICTRDFSDEETVALVNGLTTSAKEHLTSLFLCTKGLATNGSKALADFLATRRPNLIDIHLVINSIDTTTASAETVLRTLTRGLGESLCTSMRLAFPSVHMSEALVHLRAMLRGNYGVAKLQLEKCKSDSSKRIKTTDEECDFLIKANKLGRGDLFQRDNNDSSFPTEEEGECTWMTLFGATEGSLDNIYYLVRSHPNEFATMGLHDCSENMVPTTRVMKNLLRQSIESFGRKAVVIDSALTRTGRARTAAINTAVDRIELALSNEMEDTAASIVGDTEALLSTETRLLKKRMESESANLSSQLKLTKQSLKQSMAGKVQAQTTEMKCFIEGQTQAVQSYMDSALPVNLNVFSREVQDNLRVGIESALAEQTTELDAVVKSALAEQEMTTEAMFKSVLTKREKMAETKLKKALAEQEKAMETKFKAELAGHKDGLVQIQSSLLAMKDDAKVHSDRNGSSISVLLVVVAILVIVSLFLAAGVASLLFLIYTNRADELRSWLERLVHDM
ncbi:expressed unknown protein [Seminavis robusta]|uniref:Uncharacterized protein n=1 Tax=Seminavis robusta TaxID=568900 RepID=A0A9N8HBG0_9STRA|nr:expressed unknown protein [Seminavis robusta]|eukprot:Sro181_g079200.1 n/a (712) ;mRNA; r:83963-86098